MRRRFNGDCLGLGCICLCPAGSSIGSEKSTFAWGLRAGGDMPRKHSRWLIIPESVLIYMGSCLENKDMELETAEGQQVPCEDFIKLVLQLIL